MRGYLYIGGNQALPTSVVNNQNIAISASGFVKTVLDE